MSTRTFQFKAELMNSLDSFTNMQQQNETDSYLELF